MKTPRHAKKEEVESPRGLRKVSRTLMLFLPFFTFSCICSLVLLYYSFSVERHAIQHEQLHTASVHKEIAIDHIREATSNLHIVANLKEAQYIWDDSTTAQTKKEDLHLQLLNIMLHHQFYDQIRFIDPSGQEQVRVNYNNGDPYVVPESELQNKANRYYIIEALKLSPGDLYISPLDLNMENGVIERPLKPMLRFATTVQSQDGEILGYVVINYLAKPLLNRLALIDQRGNDSGVILLNHEGYWLRALDERDAFTFMYPEHKDISFAERYPETWSRLLQKPSNQFLTDRGMLTLHTIYPMLEARKASPNLVHNEDESHINEWHVVSIVSHQDLNATFYKTAWTAGITLFIVNMLALVVSMYISNSSEHLKQVADELKENEETQRQLLKEANVATKAKSAFLANMSHEIRTPINGILGMADQLKDTMRQETQQTQIHTIETCGNQLLNLIDDILDFSRIESGKFQIKESEFDLYNVIEDACDIVTDRANRKKLEFIVNLHPELPQMYLGAPTRIKQILINLLNNAIKYTQHGFIELKVTPQHQKAHIIHLRFAVSDSGIGIPPEHKDDLFEEFSRLEQNHNQFVKGAGLGLAICQKLTHLMHGSINVESIEGKGSTFTVDLPIKAFPPEDNDHSTHPPLEEQHILVLEQFSRQRKAIMEYLIQAGAIVYAYANVREALVHFEDMRSGQLPTLNFCIFDQATCDSDEKHDLDSIMEYAKQCTTGLKAHFLILQSGQTIKQDNLPRLSKPIHYHRLLYSIENVQAASKQQNTIEKSKPLNAALNLRVLLVEDNNINQMVAMTILQKRLSCKVDVVENGQEAIDLLKKRHYDLILMDCQMPVMDGYEATRLIRLAETGVLQNDIPIIALTAHAVKGDREKCFDAGMNAYITKPFNVDDLSAVIRNTLTSPTPEALM